MIAKRNDLQFNVAGNPDFWNKYPRWERGTFKVLDTYLRKDTLLIDIGAWIGPISLYAAAKGNKTISIEADPVAINQLRGNIAINPALAPHITLIERALHTSSSPVHFGALGKAGGSTSSSVHAKFAESWIVPTIRPIELFELAKDAKNILIKMDIEGGEYIAFPSLVEVFRELRPTILLSLHPFFLPYGYLQKRQSSRQIFDACRDYRWKRVRHKERYFPQVRDWFHKARINPAHPRGPWLFTPINA